MKKITLLLSAVLFTVMSFAGTYTHTFAKDELTTGEVTLSEVTWKTTMEGSTYYGWDGNNNRGVQIGKSKEPCTSYTLKTSAFDGAITKVIVNASIATRGTAKLSISVGGTSYLADQALTTTATDYVATGTATGDLLISYVNDAKAFYIKSITVVYGEGGETPDTPTEPENPDTPTEPETPIEPETPAVPEGAITCAEAVTICEKTGSTLTAETYTIRGYVTEIKYTWSEKFGTATFWIADTKDGGQVLQAYTCAPLTDADKVFAVGDYVELVGKLKKHNTTNEVEKGTYTVITAADGGETPEPEPTPDPEEPETPAEPITIAAALQLEDNAACVLDPFTVIYVSGAYIYIEDESAYALLYKYDFGLKAGDQVTGLEVTKSTYQGIAQLTPVTALSELTIVEGEAPAIDEITSAPTVADNHLVKLVNAKLAGAIVANATVVATCSDNTTINIYSKSDFAIEDGKAYNIIGGVTQYKGVIQIQAYEVEEYTDVESGVEDVIVNEKMTKVIKNGKMYIIRDGKAYNVLGAQL